MWLSDGPIINLNIFPLFLRIVSKLKLVLVFCNALVTGNHQTYFPQGGGGGGNMRHAEVSQRHIFLKILSQNVRHNPDLVGGLVEKLSTVYGMWGIILVSFSYGYSLPLQKLRMPNCKCPHMCIYMQVIW